PFFEAALRAVRADYCGDGESHAGSDAQALLADVWGIRGAFGSVPEARWSDGGALCLSHARDDDADAAAIRQACGIPTCGPGPLGSQGELLVSSLP
ncbi:MAG: hypothetical protein KC420_06865, partial [Myxococcales bacterium]|nr:hypothetical protein [Myxococcales bacterium]